MKLSGIKESGNPESCEIIHKRKDGKPITIYLILSPIKDGIGKISGISMIARDISKRVATEQQLKDAYEKLRVNQAQLAQASKLSAIGRLAVGAAHEINNPMCVIYGEAEIMILRRSEDNEIREAAKAIMEQALRVERIVDRLLNFSKQPDQGSSALNINNLVKESIWLLDFQAKLENIKIVRNLADELPRVLVNKINIEEVFLNIMLNAVQSMSGSGVLTVTTGIESGKGADKYVFAEFKDSGNGMDEEELNRIFEAFFTTKENGTGLGLFVANSIIRKYGGSIDVRSKLGEGAVFTVRLPAIP